MDSPGLHLAKLAETPKFDLGSLQSSEVDAKSAADCVRRGVDGVAVVSPVKG